MLAAGPAHLPPGLQCVEPYVGRMHIGRNDLQYTSLSGSDPVPSRPNLYLLTGLGVNSRLYEVGTGQAPRL